MGQFGDFVKPRRHFQTETRYLSRRTRFYRWSLLVRDDLVNLGRIWLKIFGCYARISTMKTWSLFVDDLFYFSGRSLQSWGHWLSVRTISANHCCLQSFLLLIQVSCYFAVFWLLWKGDKMKPGIWIVCLCKTAIVTQVLAGIWLLLVIWFRQSQSWTVIPKRGLLILRLLSRLQVL